jgi:hypothetical protein
VIVVFLEQKNLFFKKYYETNQNKKIQLFVYIRDERLC